MAFNGNLHEFGIVALLQLPNTNRLTGRLSVSGVTGKAEFFYEKGKLNHAVCNDITGKEVLAAVIDWDEGKFSFESDIGSESKTIEQDLHHTLMWALKERDERKKKEDELKAAEEERKMLEAQQARAAEPEIEPVIIPDELLQAAPHANFACIINNKGMIAAKSNAGDEYMASILGYLNAVRSFIREYPAGAVGKTFIDDDSYSLGLCGNEKGYTTVLFAAPNTRLGILSMELGKFMNKLDERGFGDEYEGSGE